jgi:tetratricopeptide (TPR) repeat protein
LKFCRSATAVAAISAASLLHGPGARSEANPPVHACDRLTAKAYEGYLVTAPINAQSVVQACKAALNEFPDTPRFQAQLGWAFYKADQKGQAVEWFRKAAEHGNALGQLWLGQMYYFGIGLPKDSTQAAKWFRTAAEQGNALGQLWLGGMYFSGLGVPKDSTQAVEWFKKAAEQGNALAQAYLVGIEAFRKLLDEADVKELINLDQISTNPFVYDNKKILTHVIFKTMLSKDTALFGGPSEFVLISNLPTGMFTKEGVAALLVGRVQDKEYVKLPAGGEALVTHLEYFDARICQNSDCGVAP